MNRYLRYRHRIIYGLLCLLLINSATPAVASVSSLLQQDADNGSNRILLCTPQGFKWVDSRSFNNEPLPTHSTTVAHQCPLCGHNHLNHDDLTLTTTLRFELTAVAQSCAIYQPQTNLPPQHTLLNYLFSRAPPTFS